MKQKKITALVLAAIISLGVNTSGADKMNFDALDSYNVVWDSPSENYNGTMPIGNGDMAANVWMEPNGDLIFYLSKSDSWSGHQELLKLGRVRVRLDKPFFKPGVEFKQELDLKTGTIYLQSREGGKTGTINFWIDANNPVVNVEIKSSEAFQAQVMLEVWRTKDAKSWGASEPDTVLPAAGNTIRWYYRNKHSIYNDTLKNQHLEQLVGKYPDPLENLTFGGLISGNGLKNKDNKTLVTGAPTKDLIIRIYGMTAQTKTPEEWVEKLQKQRIAVDGLAYKETRTKHENYWSDFWNRSWIFISPGKGAAKRKTPSLIPSNTHSFQVGTDTNGGNRFTGTIGRVSLLNKALSSAEIKKLADSQALDIGLNKKDLLYSGKPELYQALPDSATWTNTPELTVEAWINPLAENPGTRILDKSTPGKDDGFLLDTHPGNSLRLIIGQNSYGVPACLKAGKWNHVAVTVDADTDRIELYLNGERIAGSAPLAKPTDEFAVTRAYVLQRWIQACAGRGAYPIKFNGSLFSVDYVHRKHDGSLQKLGPDARQWGGCYWFQNTREPYWAMLYSGDYDQMEPLWRMYRDALPLLKERTRKYFGHDGANFSETMHFWGLNPQHDFGYGNKGFYPTNPYIRYYWDCGIELSMMMLDYNAHMQDKTFVANTLIPIADEVVKFYDQHYKRNAQGKVHISPSASLETWHSAEDPLPVVVGLKTVLTRLLELPETQTTPEQRERWKRFRSELPEVPIGEENGKKWIKPAHVYSDQRNSENPELYAVFPYRAYTVDKPGLDVAIETWRKRLVKRTGGWSQDPIQAAMLGLTQEAKDYVVKNATDIAPAGRPVVEPRFPAFWGPNFDWTPDQCHGSVTLIAIQRMLMLCDGDTIHLLPAWPEDWNADFKLHAPYQTTVEGRVENGKVVDLKVTPESRRKDVVVVKKK